ncbi:MAG: hypothetical protein ACFB3T_02335 [Geminicoccaceae bacterium]
MTDRSAQPRVKPEQGIFLTARLLARADPVRALQRDRPSAVWLLEGDVYRLYRQFLLSSGMSRTDTDRLLQATFARICRGFRETLIIHPPDTSSVVVTLIPAVLVYDLLASPERLDTYSPAAIRQIATAARALRRWYDGLYHELHRPSAWQQPAAVRVSLECHDQPAAP